ncbi:MAG TPA: EamA family transporter [Candidatus Saccharimonadales bacterium]|nr:EamA family transporter [Candidatus Saccharimonadales bacterium]
MWLFYSVLAGAFYTAESLLQRFHLRRKRDVWTFALFYTLIGTVVTFPFMLASPKMPTHFETWLLSAVVGLLIVGNNMLFFKATGLIEMSVINSLLKLRLAWVFIFGVLFLHAHFSWQELLGTILAMCAGWVILHSFKKPESIKGISFILTMTIVNASIIVLLKYLLSSYNAVSLTFFATFLPAAIFTIVLMPKAVTRFRHILKDDWRIIFLACVFGALTNLALNAALSLHDAAGVLAINEAFLVLVLVGEHVYLKEREHTWIRVVSVTLAIAGAILIDVSH